MLDKDKKIELNNVNNNLIGKGNEILNDIKIMGELLVKLVEWEEFERDFTVESTVGSIVYKRAEIEERLRGLGIADVKEKTLVILRKELKDYIGDLIVETNNIIIDSSVSFESAADDMIKHHNEHNVVEYSKIDDQVLLDNPIVESVMGRELANYLEDTIASDSIKKLINPNITDVTSLLVLSKVGLDSFSNRIRVNNYRINRFKESASGIHALILSVKYGIEKLSEDGVNRGTIIETLKDDFDAAAGRALEDLSWQNSAFRSGLGLPTEITLESLIVDREATMDWNSDIPKTESLANRLTDIHDSAVTAHNNARVLIVNSKGINESLKEATETIDDIKDIFNDLTLEIGNYKDWDSMEYRKLQGLVDIVGQLLQTVITLAIRINTSNITALYVSVEIAEVIAIINKALTRFNEKVKPYRG